MSKTGVPYSASSPWTVRMLPSVLSSLTIVSAMGFGRSGVRVAKTPSKGMSFLPLG